MVRTKVFQNSLGLKFDTPMYKTFVTLTVDDVVESTDYILSTASNVLVKISNFQAYKIIKLEVKT